MLPVAPSFFPDSDRPQFVIDVWLPETASIYRTAETTRQVEALVRRLSRVTRQDGAWVEVVDQKGNPFSRLHNMVSFIGQGGPRFYTGTDPKPDAEYYALLLVNATDPEAGEPRLQPVRQLEPSPWGLHDMLGNVFEWTADWGEGDYPPGSAVDPPGLSNAQYRMLRGGSYFNTAELLRPSKRFGGPPDGRGACRVVLPVASGAP